MRRVAALVLAVLLACPPTVLAQGTTNIRTDIKGATDAGLPTSTAASADRQPLDVILRDSAGATVSVGGGTQYNEGTAGTGTDTTTLSGCIRRDAAGVAAGVADGDRTPCVTDANGNVRVHLDNVNVRVNNAPAAAANVILRDTAGAYVSVGGGTQYDQGSAGTTTDTGTVALAHRKDTAAAAAGVADGDRVVLSTDSLGNLRVHLDNITVGGRMTVSQPKASDLKIDLSDTGANATAIKVDGSAVTQPVSGTVTANAGSGTFTISGTVTANAGTNLNTSALLTTTAHDNAFGTAGAADAQVRSVQGVASMTPLLTDGSATTQPVSGTVTAAQTTATSLKAEVVGPTADNAANPTAKLSVLPAVAKHYNLQESE